jgi:hypothetical protein
MVWTYNSFVDEINDNFASLHLQIKRFEIGFYDDMSVYITKNELWPIMWIVPIDIIHLKNSVSQYNLRVYFLDLLDNDNSNERDVLSDQLSISRDFINWLRLNEYSFDLLNDPTATPVKSIAMDYTAGWYVDVSLEVETEGSDCSIPFSGASGTQSGCPLSYVVNSDGSYSVELQSGETLILPDISITSNGTFSQTIPAQTSYLIPDVNWIDSDGTTMSTSYGDGITCQTVADANIEINGVLFDTVAPGATLSIAVIRGGGGAVGFDNGTEWEIGNCQPIFNGVNMDSIEAESNKNYNIYLDGVLSGTGSVTTWNLTSNTGWIRPADWIAIPSLTSADERFYGVVAVFENAYNQVNININNLAANINWGDGTSVVSNGAMQTKVYNYSTLSATIYQWPDGRNYKMALVDITRVGGAITSVDFWSQSAINSLGGNNFIDINLSLPNATTLQLALEQTAGTKAMQLLQRLRVWQRPAAHSASNICRGMRGLRVLEYPYGRIGIANNMCYDSTQLDNTGDITYTTATLVQQVFYLTNVKKHGNLVANSATTATGYISYSNLLTQFGTITMNTCTSMDSFFYDCALLTSVGLITTPLCTNLSSFAFRCWMLSGLIFSDCAAVTTTTSMVSGCYSLYYLVMPGLTRGVSFTGTAMGNYGMNLFANSIGTASGVQNITITGTPFGALILAGDATALAIRLVMTGKGYTIIN